MEKKFQTPLGIVRCGFFCNAIVNPVGAKSYKNGNSEIFKTKGHTIEIISFKIKIPLYNGDTLTDSFGWIFRIKNINNSDEQIETYCLLERIVTR